MKKVKPEDEEKKKKEEEDKPFYIDIFGDTMETRKLLEHPDIQQALGSSPMKRFVRADKPPTNFVNINKKQIKTLETTVKMIQHSGTVNYSSSKTMSPENNFYNTQ